MEISNLQLDPSVIDPTSENDGTHPFEIFTFSDSIVIFSKNNTIESFDIFTQTVNYFFSQLIHKNIAVKGSIAYGQLSLDSDKQIFFGQPLIDAFLLQEEVDYLGVVAHNTIDSYIADNLITDKVMKQFFEESAPLKSGKITHLNLNYFPFFVYDDVDEMPKYFEKFKLTMSGKPRKYLENTINFYHQYIKTIK